MPETVRSLSPYAADAVTPLDQLLRKTRIESKLKTAEAAERAEISLDLMRRIEAGDPGCTIGAAFEVATIVGLPLFNSDQATMSRIATSNREVMKLLPKSVRTSRIEIDDEF
ncbi:helix-turn-helix domain-containing protein [Tardiphaga robiniae]|uniref:Helix-turn-helix domain-containing protein n=1 Tax=Tardiphaga robiniae TaxID=943830 RepID=A0A7G6TUF5_9BRAD|nr:helix-turn-helix domain-containing protein [Tardiphaga robiniae]QND70387.1 helix-turn-helix domain-containing protein [Tardiphaga robiniae]